MRSFNTQDKLSLQNYRTIDSAGSRTVYHNNESEINSQKKLIIDLRSELSNLKTEFTKLITKPTQNTADHLDTDNNGSKMGTNARKQQKLVFGTQNQITKPSVSNAQSRKLPSKDSPLLQNSQYYSGIHPETKITSHYHTETIQKYDTRDDNLSETKSNTNSNSTDKSKSLIYAGTVKHRFYSTNDTKNCPNDECRQSSKSSGSHNHNIGLKNANFQKDKQPVELRSNHAVNCKNKIEKEINEPKETITIRHNIHERDKRLCQSTYFLHSQTQSTLQHSVLSSIKDDQYIMLRATISQLQDEKNEIESKLKRMEEEMAMKNHENQAKNKRIKQLEASLISYQKINKNYDNHSSMYSSQIQLHDNVQETDKQKILKNTRILEIRLRQQSQRNSLLQKQIQRLGKQINSLNDETKEHQTKNQQLEQKNSSLTNQLQTTKKSETKKTEWINSLSKKVRELEANKSILINDYESTITSLKDQIEELKKMGPVITEKDALIEKSQANIRQKDEIICKFLREKKQLMTEKEQLKKQIQVLESNSKITQLQSTLQNQKTRTQALIKKKQEENKQLFKTIRYQKQQIEKLNNKNDTLEQTKNQLLSTVRRQESPKKSSSPRKQKKSPQNEQVVINNLLSDLSVLEKQINECQKKNGLSMDMVDEVNDEIMRTRMSVLNQKYARFYI